MGDWPKTVRTTIQPDVDVEVGPEAWQELKVQGLLLPGYEGDYQGVVPARREAAPKSSTKEG